MKITNNPIRQAITSTGSAKTDESKLTKTAPVKAEYTTKADSFVSIYKPDASIDVDMNKVNEISALLADGKLELDLDVLSDAILGMHRR